MGNRFDPCLIFNVPKSSDMAHSFRYTCDESTAPKVALPTQGYDELLAFSKGNYKLKFTAFLPAQRQHYTSGHSIPKLTFWISWLGSAARAADPVPCLSD